MKERGGGGREEEGVEGLHREEEDYTCRHWFLMCSLHKILGEEVVCSKYSSSMTNGATLHENQLTHLHTLLGIKQLKREHVIQDIDGSYSCMVIHIQSQRQQSLLYVCVCI